SVDLGQSIDHTVAIQAARISLRGNFNSVFVGGLGFGLGSGSGPGVGLSLPKLLTSNTTNKANILVILNDFIRLSADFNKKRYHNGVCYLQIIIYLSSKNFFVNSKIKNSESLAEE